MTKYTNKNNSSRYRIVLPVAAIACFWSGATSVGVLFSLLLITNIAYFIYYQKKGQNKRFDLAECIIVLLSSLLFGIYQFILNDWLLVGLSSIVVIFLGYCTIKIAAAIKQHFS